MSLLNARKDLSQTVIHERFQLTKKIGNGSFGDIYIAEDLRTGNKFAAKIEFKNPGCIGQLKWEANFYKHIRKTESLDGFTDFPIIVCFKRTADYDALVMELCGHSLEAKFQMCGRKFSMKTIAMLAEQMISSIERLHGHGYIHRDIKPDNFVMGIGNKEKFVRLIDFGLTKKVDSASKQVASLMKKSLTGTARYASINSHSGFEQSRRDDLESLGYTLVYFCRGSLPWQGQKNLSTDQKYKAIKEAKLLSSDNLCDGLPAQFKCYFDYIRDLPDSSLPNYNFLKHLFVAILQENNFTYDYKYDWDSDELSKQSPRLPLQTSSSTLVKHDLQHRAQSAQGTCSRRFNPYQRPSSSNVPCGAPSPISECSNYYFGPESPNL